MSPPSGTITFLFTDIEGSTRLWQAAPEAMAVALRRHDAILREVLIGNEGFIFKTVGDAFYCAFPTARRAVTAALAGQKALTTEPWPPETGPLRARMALHTGTAEERDGDYFGPSLNRIARLLSSGHGGQILLSAATAALVAGDPPPDVSLIDLGLHRLKDLAEDEAIFQLASADLPAEFPPLRTIDTRRNNLPVQLTPLIGRRHEVNEVMSLLRQPGVRLVTLTGVGGTGKTRLSLQVAAELAGQYEHGVHFIDLAPVTTPDGVAPAIVSVLGLAARSQEDPTDILKKYLASRQSLLVLDNFEQIIAAAPLPAGLLAGAPNLQILVTSRELLRVSGEYEYAVPPLSLPDLSHPATVAGLLQYESVALFLERVKSVNRDFALDESNARAVAEICVRLDGLPLAIELAAARVRLFSPQTLLARLDDLLGTLGAMSGGLRNAPARQKTLRATIDWSYDLLDAPEKKLFARLAVFSGGWSIDAAEAICGDGLPIAVVDGLESLLNKSLVRRVAGQTDNPRLTMLETIHEYALDALEQRGERAAIQRRHGEYFYAIARDAAEDLRGFRQLEWLQRLDWEHDNLLAALKFFLEGSDSEMGVRLTVALRDYWLYSYKHTEGEAWLKRAALYRDTISPQVRAEWLATAGVMAVFRLKPAEASLLLEEAIAEARLLDDPRLLAWAKIWWSAMRIGRDDPHYETALQWTQEAIDTFKALGYLPGVTQGMNIHGEILRSGGDFIAAEAIYQAIIPLALEIGDFRRVVFQYANLAQIAFERRDAASMLHNARLGLPLSLDHRVEETTALFLVVVGVVSRWNGRPDIAAQLVGAADAWYEDTSVKIQINDVRPEQSLRAEIRRGVDTTNYQQGWQAGRAMSLREALSLALAEIEWLEPVAAAPPAVSLSKEG